MNLLNKAINHFKTIATHRKWVRHYCFKIGLYRQGIFHDFSKYSPVEFLESIKYYTGTCSPIDICKKEKGYSMAWFHHRSRNKHHREFWVDNFDKGIIAVMMPKCYVFEMVCDWLGAGKAYMKEAYTPQKEYEWYLKQKMLIHPRVKRFADEFMRQYSVYGDNCINITNFNKIWEQTKEI